MIRYILLLAIVMVLGFAVSANAQSGGFGPGEYQDADGDGIPNCQDDDYVAPEDCLQHQWGQGIGSDALVLWTIARGGGGNDGEPGIEGWGDGEGDGDGIPDYDGEGDYGPGDCTED